MAPRVRHLATSEEPSGSPRYVLLPEAVAYAGVPISTVRDWVRKGLLPAYRIGPRLIQIDLNDIDRMRRRVPAVGAPEQAGPAPAADRPGRQPQDRSGRQSRSA